MKNHSAIANLRQRFMLVQASTLEPKNAIFCIKLPLVPKYPEVALPLSHYPLLFTPYIIFNFYEDTERAFIVIVFNCHA